MQGVAPHHLKQMVWLDREWVRVWLIRLEVAVVRIEPGWRYVIRHILSMNSVNFGVSSISFGMKSFGFSMKTMIFQHFQRT